MSANSPAGTSDSAGTRSSPAPSLLPPRWVWIVNVVCGLGIAAARAFYIAGEHALVNIVTFVLAMIGIMVTGIWYLFWSRFAAATRLASALVVLLAVGTFFGFYEIDSFSGDMVPHFRRRSAPLRDTTLEKVVTADTSTAADLATTTPDDFPQFLGPNRMPYLDRPKLAQDWQAKPPKELWRRPIGAGWGAFSAANGFVVTLEQRGSGECVCCYELATGKPVWSHVEENIRHESVLGGIGPRSTPAIVDGQVHTLGATGVLLCLNGSNGSVVWRVDLRQRYNIPPKEDDDDISWGRSNSPLVVDDKVIIPVGGPRNKRVSLAAFDRKTGTPIWQAGDRQVSYSSPSLAEFAGTRQILSVNENQVSSHDVETGTLLWEHPWTGSSHADANASQAVPIAPNRVLLSKGYGLGSSLLEIRSENGQWKVETIWHERTALRTKFTNVFVRNGFVYGLSDGVLECVELATGKRKWKKGRYGHGQVLGVGDAMLVLGESGELKLVEINPDAHVERGSISAFAEKTWNNLCLSGRLLLLRNGEEAVCYELSVDE